MPFRHLLSVGGCYGASEESNLYTLDLFVDSVTEYQFVFDASPGYTQRSYCYSLHNPASSWATRYSAVAKTPGHNNLRASDPAIVVSLCIFETSYRRPNLPNCTVAKKLMSFLDIVGPTISIPAARHRDSRTSSAACI